MDTKKAPSDRKEFKLITSNEHEYIQDPAKFIRSHQYKNPDAIMRQFNARIRYRSINAVRDLLFITENLPTEQLFKIFADDTRIIELFKITEKALDVASWKPYRPDTGARHSGPTKIFADVEQMRLPQANRVVALDDHLEQLIIHLFDKDDLDDHNELKKEFESPSELHHEMFMLKNELREQSDEIGRLKNFLKVRNLKEEYEAEVKSDKVTRAIHSLKEEGCSEKEIEDYLKRIK